MQIGEQLKQLRKQRLAIYEKERELEGELRGLLGPAPDELGAIVPEDEAEIIAQMARRRRAEKIKLPRRRSNLLQEIRSLLASEPAKIFTIVEVKDRLGIQKQEEPSFYAALSKLVKFQQIDRVEKARYRAHHSTPTPS